jgi:hypothetical protein
VIGTGTRCTAGVHKAQRKRFAARMRAGEIFYCWPPTCRTPNEPTDPRAWDLGHVDPELRDRFGHRWPEHRRCNRATVSHLQERLRAAEGGGINTSREW